jgi:hypothetical protein
MKRNLCVACLALIGICFFSGCAAVPMASTQADLAAKEFKTPSKNKAGVYIYRNGMVGAGIKLGLFADEQFVGSTAAKTYHYIELTPGNHTFKGIAFNSRAYNNNSVIHADLLPNKLYYIWQEFNSGTKLHIVSEKEGQKGVRASRLTVSSLNAAMAETK